MEGKMAVRRHAKTESVQAEEGSTRGVVVVEEEEEKEKKWRPGCLRESFLLRLVEKETASVMASV
jgi:hypothetical protein